MPLNIHLYPSNITNESRIYKESFSLINSGIVNNIDIIGVWREGLLEQEQLSPEILIVRIPVFWYKKMPFLKSFIYYVEWCLKIYLKYKNQKINIIQCHSLFGLFFSILLKYRKSAYLIYDTHELATEINTLKGIRKKIRKLKEKLLIPFTDKVIVVSEGIFKWYQSHYKNLDLHLIKNIPLKVEKPVEDSISKLKTFFKIENKITCIYQGSFTSGRGIELLLKVFSSISDKHIIFMGYGQLEEEIKKYAAKHKNIHIHPAVKPSEIFEYTSGVDIGFSIIENTCLSHYHCLPNKFYEYTQAGLAIVFSDFPDMKKEMKKFNNGWATTVDFKTLQTLINNLTIEAVNEKKNNAIKNRHLINWNSEGEKLVSIYKSLLK